MYTYIYTLIVPDKVINGCKENEQTSNIESKLFMWEYWKYKTMKVLNSRLTEQRLTLKGKEKVG